MLYVGLGIVLAAGAVALLVKAAIDFAKSCSGGAIGSSVVAVLDRVLLILMMIEILYTSGSASTCWCPSPSCRWP